MLKGWERVGRRRVWGKTILGRKLCCGSLFHTKGGGGASPSSQTPEGDSKGPFKKHGMEGVGLRNNCSDGCSGWELLSEAIPYSVGKGLDPWPWWSVALSWINQGLPDRFYKMSRSKFSPYSYLLPFHLGLRDPTSDRESGMDWPVPLLLWNIVVAPPFSHLPFLNHYFLKNKNKKLGMFSYVCSFVLFFIFHI